MRQKKILFVVTKGNWGGVQRYVYDLATRMPKRLFEITVAVGAGSLLPTDLAAAGIRTIPLLHLGRDVRAKNDLRSFFALLKLFRCEKPDILHLNSSKAGAMGALAGRLARVPHIIFTAHGWAFNEDRGRGAKFIIALLHWLTILLAHQTIVVAEAPRQQMDHFPFVKRRMTVIRNGLSRIEFLNRPQARQELLVERSGGRGDTLWLGTISELHKNKGLEYLIQAFVLLKPAVTLVVIGEGEERPRLEKLIKELKLENQIFLLGQKVDAARYLKAFDIFTLPSITEAFPYVILEAGAAGLPIVASGVGGIPEIIESMRSGVLVKPRAPGEIAKAIEFLLAHPAKTAQMGETLHNRVVKEFSVERMIKETIAVYAPPKNSLPSSSR